MESDPPDQSDPPDEHTPDIPEESAQESEGKPPDSQRPDLSNEILDPSELWEAIETERRELQQIAAMLRCLEDVLLYSDDDDGSMHADVAHVCHRLLRDVMERLELLPKKFRVGGK